MPRLGFGKTLCKAAGEECLRWVRGRSRVATSANRRIPTLYKNKPIGVALRVLGFPWAGKLRMRRPVVRQLGLSRYIASWRILRAAVTIAITAPYIALAQIPSRQIPP